MDQFIKIKGNLNPVKFMNSLVNKIKSKFEQNCIIEEKKNKLKFKVYFDEDEENNEEKEENEEKIN